MVFLLNMNKGKRLARVKIAMPTAQKLRSNHERAGLELRVNSKLPTILITFASKLHLKLEAIWKQKKLETDGET